MGFLSNTFALMALGCSVVVSAAQPDGPLSLQGKISGMEGTGTAVNSGGFITVNGVRVVIPDNSYIAFPAAFVPFAEVRAAWDAGTLGDDNKLGHEISITGNIIGGKPVAGLIYVSGNLAEQSTGYISGIDMTTGKMTIDNGPTIAINDPNGVYYAKAYKDRPLFTADDENPSITAFSGFPMCVPNNATDALCPLSNRPPGNNDFTAVDPAVMVPFTVGDYITFSGINVGGTIYCYSIVANVMINTKPGTAPGYMRIEDNLIGIIDADPNLEFAQSKFVGYTSDSQASIKISAIDVDPCTGKPTTRQITSGLGPDAVGNRKRFRFLTDRLAIGKYTREYLYEMSSGTFTTKNGIVAGQYHQPVTEWVFPELIAVGAVQPLNDFSDLAHLVNGVPSDNGDIFLQLNPWPGRGTAPAVSPACKAGDKIPTAPPTGTTQSGLKPIASIAAPVISNLPGAQFKFVVTNTQAGVDALDLTYAWTQVDTTAALTTGVIITGADTDTLLVTTPTQGTITPLMRKFSVVLTSTVGTVKTVSDPAVVTITTGTSLATFHDNVVLDSYKRINSGGGTITVNAHSDLVNDPKATMTIKVGTANPVAMVKVGTNTGRWTYTQTNVKVGVGVSVTSSGGGTSGAQVVPFRKREVVFNS